MSATPTDITPARKAQEENDLHSGTQETAPESTDGFHQLIDALKAMVLTLSTAFLVFTSPISVVLHKPAGRVSYRFVMSNMRVTLQLLQAFGSHGVTLTTRHDLTQLSMRRLTRVDPRWLTPA